MAGPRTLTACACAALALVLCAPAAASAGGWSVSALPAGAGAPSSFAEPGVASGPGGLTVVNASTANSGAPATFWLSHDAGAHWGRGFAIGDASTGDSDVAIGPDGTIYALVLGYGASPPAQPSNPTVLVYRSRDGSHWLGPASFPPPRGADQPDRPWLAVAGGRVLVFNSEGGGNIVAWRSTDGGASFQGPVPVTGGPDAQAGLALGSRPLVDPARPSRIALLYETAGGAAPPVGLSQLTDLAGALIDEGEEPRWEFPLTQLWLAGSEDGGATWSNRPVLDASSAFGGGTLGHLLPASATDRAGNLYVVLSVRPGGTRETRLVILHSTDHGARWSTPSPLATGTPSNVMPAVAAAASGRVF